VTANADRAHLVGKHNDFKMVDDDETKRALFPSNHPQAA
jgi:GST-like protein